MLLIFFEICILPYHKQNAIFKDAFILFFETCYKYNNFANISTFVYVIIYDS